MRCLPIQPWRADAQSNLNTTKPQAKQLMKQVIQGVWKLRTTSQPKFPLSTAMCSEGISGAVTLRMTGTSLACSWNWSLTFTQLSILGTGVDEGQVLSLNLDFPGQEFEAALMPFSVVSFSSERNTFKVHISFLFKTRKLYTLDSTFKSKGGRPFKTYWTHSINTFLVGVQKDMFSQLYSQP